MLPRALARGHADPLPVAIPQEVGKSPANALSNRELQALLDDEDLENYRRSLPPKRRDDA